MLSRLDLIEAMERRAAYEQTLPHASTQSKTPTVSAISDKARTKFRNLEFLRKRADRRAFESLLSHQRFPQTLSVAPIMNDPNGGAVRAAVIGFDS
jgi:hypothetical protein